MHRAAKRGLPTPQPPTPVALPLNRLWEMLTDEDRRRTLATLSRIVARQLPPPLDDKGVTHEAH